RKFQSRGSQRITRGGRVLLIVDGPPLATDKEVFIYLDRRRYADGEPAKIQHPDSKHVICEHCRVIERGWDVWTEDEVIESVWLPKVTSVGRYAFRNCKRLAHVSLPVVESIGGSAFLLCSSLRGDAVTALTQDISSVETFSHEPMQALLGAIAAPFVVFLVLLFQDLPMAAATILSIIAAIPVFIWTNRVFKSLAIRRQDLQAEASSRMIEYVQGLPVIRAFGLSGERIQTFQQALDDFRETNTLLAVRLAPLGMLFLATVFIGIPLILFIGSYWLLGGTLDAGVFIVFAVLSLRVYLPMAFAAEQFEQLRIADASLDRIARIFDTEPEQEPAQPADLPQTFDVTFDKVVFGYDPEQPVINDVSFTAPSGKVTAIVGPSGAGKSTLLKLISRFDSPQQGTVRFGGIALDELSTEQVFDAITFVFQDVYLFPGTIRDNIAFGRDNVTDEQVIAAAKAAQADDFIQRMPQGYDTPVGEAGARLSGGERQRISIARAILKDAPIVLLDEATASLDPTNERLVQEGIASLSRSKTVIVVAHRLATIQSADQIIVLDNGKLVESGQHDGLIANDGMYAKLWAERTRASEWRLSRGME
ncbi:MAG: ATP-binding cassette domain-containing protein, partial [Pseudomonadota bacterium]